MPQPLVIFTVWLLIVLGAALQEKHSSSWEFPLDFLLQAKVSCSTILMRIMQGLWRRSLESLLEYRAHQKWTCCAPRTIEHHFSTFIMAEQGIIQQVGSQWFNLHPKSKQTTSTGSSPLQEGDPYLSVSSSTTKTMAGTEPSTLHSSHWVQLGGCSVLSPGAW